MRKEQGTMRVLIVGANGFIGRSLCQACLDASWKVEGVIHRNRNYVPKGVVTHGIAELEEESHAYDVVIIATGNFRSSAIELLEANIIVPQQIVRLFPEAKIIYVSSIAVYGSHSETITMQSSFRTPGPYGLSKIAGEFVMSTHKKASVVRLSNVYGYGMDKTLFIAKAIEEARKSSTITLFGDGTRIQDYFYIQDAVRFILAVSFFPKNGIFLGASGASVSNRQVAEAICGIIPDTKIVYQGSDHAASLRVDPSESFTAIGFSCKYSLEMGLQDMIAHHA